jgi:hypothetical protein
MHVFRGPKAEARKLTSLHIPDFDCLQAKSSVQTANIILCRMVVHYVVKQKSHNDARSCPARSAVPDLRPPVRERHVRKTVLRKLFGLRKHCLSFFARMKRSRVKRCISQVCKEYLVRFRLFEQAENMPSCLISQRRRQAFRVPV